MNVFAARLEANTTCTRCGHAVALDGATDGTRCGSCQALLETPASFWTDVLKDVLATVGRLKDGATSAESVESGSRSIDAKCARIGACCPGSCATPYPIDDLLAAVATGRVACRACGRVASVRTPPAWYASVDPRAALFVGETLTATTSAAVSGPIDVHCIQCGVKQSIDGRERALHCRQCRAQIYLPDDLWLRVHPDREHAPWFVVVDMGESVGLAPDAIDDMLDVTVEAHGNMVIAFMADEKGDVGHACRMASIDRRGLLRWLQDGVEFSDDARLHVSPLDGSLLLVDSEGCFVRYLDAQTGRPLRTVQCHITSRTQRDESHHEPQRLELFEHRGVAVDHDGTILVLRGWREGERPSLRRFAPDGSPVPLWPEPSPGRAPKLPVDYPRWDQVGARIVVPPESAFPTIGWDGCLYLCNADGIAKFTRDGSLVGVVPLERAMFGTIRDAGVDRGGAAYVLFEHRERIGDSSYSDVLRVSPDGRPQLWLGPHVAPDAPYVINNNERHMALMPDGTLYFASSELSLRIIGPDRQLVWRSAKTVEDDAYETEQLAKQRRPKRLAEDGAG